MGTCRTCDLSMAQSRAEEDDVCDVVRLYKDTMGEDEMELGDPLVRALTQKELKIAKLLSTYRFGIMS